MRSISIVRGSVLGVVVASSPDDDGGVMESAAGAAAVDTLRRGARRGRLFIRAGVPGVSFPAVTNAVDDRFVARLIDLSAERVALMLSRRVIMMMNAFS